MYFAPPAVPTPPAPPPNDLKPLEIAFFALCALFCLVGGVTTVAAKNPIRGAMGLLVTIIGIAGMYLLLSAELLAAIQVIVYAGAVVILFLFVIMLLGPSAAESSDARGALSRYFGAGVFVVASVGILWVVMQTGGKTLTQLPPPPAGLGTIEVIGRELFSTDVVPFQIAGVLLLIAVVGAVAVARGRGPEDGALRALKAGALGPSALAKPPTTPPLLAQQTRLEITDVPPISAKGTATVPSGGGHAASKAAHAPKEEVQS